MSGFEYHLCCARCGEAGPTLPFRYDAVVAPTSLVLPAAGFTTGVALPVDGGLTIRNA